MVIQLHDSFVAPTIHLWCLGFLCHKDDIILRPPERKESIHITPIHTPVHLNAWDNRFSFHFLPLSWIQYSAIFCHLSLPYSVFLHLLSFSFSHTFIGGPSLVGIHQGPSLSPAMPQCQRTMVGQRQPSLLMSTGYGCVRGCGWVGCVCTHVYLF